MSESNPEPHYVNRPEAPDTPPSGLEMKRHSWRNLARLSLLELGELLGVTVICLGVAYYEAGAGMILAGVYICYRANLSA